MSELRIHLDPRNPGQFFGCCGLLELAAMETAGALGWFVPDKSNPRSAEFILENGANLKDTLTRLTSAEPEFVEEVSEVAVRPAEIRYGGSKLTLDWWLDEFREETTNLKCWAGQVTTPKLFGELLPKIDLDSSGSDLFQRPRMSKSKFGVDPRSAWNALDFGFSPNEQGKDAATFPAVEILAAIGLQGFRPDASRRADVRYMLWAEPLPASVARMAFRCPWDGLHGQQYRFSIDKRGQSYKYFTFAEMARKDGGDR